MGNLVSFKSVLFTLLFSMAPVSELRGAIPYGLAHDIPLWLLLPMCVIANLLPVPFIILFLRKVLSCMQRLGGKPEKLAGWLIERGYKKSMIIKNMRRWAFSCLSPSRCREPVRGRARWSRR